MAVQWSTSAAPVAFELRRDDAVPLGVQLEGLLRDAIRTGRLGAGERLTSTRALAEQLGVSRGLVQECYEQLIAEGYLVARSGSATRVARLPRVPRAGTLAPTGAADPPLVVGFPSGVPDLGMMPRLDWAWAVREACRVLPNALLDYAGAAGDPELRDVVAAYLRRVRALDVGPEDVVVCAGFAQGMVLAADALVAVGITVIAHEDPGSGRTIRAAARAGGATAVAVPVDEQGIDVEALEASGARAVVVTAAHQWPTGEVLSPERRRRLLAWAERVDGVIIEDDYDAEFRYDRDPVGSMQGLAPDRVLSIGTVSKSLAPGLRLGWMATPPRLLDGVLGAKAVADRGSPAIDQRALALLMTSGRYDRHLRRMRAEYGRRREILVASIARWAPQLRISGLAAGFHAVIHLPDGADAAAFAASARQAGLGISPMSRFHSSGGPDPRLVLGFGNTPPEAIERGIRMLAELVQRP